MQLPLEDYLSNRRSVKIMDMKGEAPSISELQKIMRIASRTPDHGKIVPWRFCVLPQENRSSFCSLVEKATRNRYSDPSPETVEKELSPFKKNLGIIILIFSPVDHFKIPLWEQQLTCGAVGMNILHAAHAYGYVAQWLTGWISDDQTINAKLGLQEQEKIAGYFYIGNSDQKPEDRARPNMSEIITSWEG